MLRTYEPESRKAVFSLEATARIVAGKQRMTVRPVKQPKRGNPYGVDELKKLYTAHGAPLGSAYVKGPREYILLAEKLFCNEEGFASYGDGTPVTPPLKWEWQKNILAASWQPKDTCRMRIPIIDVEIIHLNNIKERTIREWMGIPYKDDFLTEFDKNNSPEYQSENNPVAYVYLLGKLEHIGGAS